MPTVASASRIKLQNILYATDLSQSAQTVLSHALDLARHYGAVLYTVHVLPHMPFVEAAAPYPAEIKSHAKEDLNSLTSSVSWQAVGHKELIERGEVCQVLEELVRKYDIDLILLGSGGRTGLEKLLLGSVAEEVFRRAECPVLTVGPHATRWQIDGNPQDILFATDFGQESLHALPYALSLAEENRARLTMLHVAPEPGIALLEPEPGAMPVVDPKELVASTEKQLRALLPEGTQLAREPEYLVHFGSPAEIILRVAQAADMIVIGVKRPAVLTKHLGAGVAYKVACEARCPVLSVGERFHQRRTG